jgi:hypothetical protein
MQIYKLNSATKFTKAQVLQQEQKVKELFKNAYKSVKFKNETIEYDHTWGNKDLPKNWAELKLLENELKEASGIALKNVQEHIIDTVGKTAEMVVKDYTNILKSANLKIEEAFVNVPKDTVKAIVNGSMYDPPMHLSDRIWPMEQKIRDDIDYIVAQGVALQKPTYDIAKDLEKYVNPEAKKDWSWSKVYPGTSKRVDYNAQRVARTSITHGYQYSVKNCAENDPIAIGIEWLASNSVRSCPICQERNGKIYKPEDLPLDHPNGMCTMAIAYDKSLDEIADELSAELQKEFDEQINLMNEETKKKAEEIANKESVAKVPEKKVKVPTFTWYQNEYLGKYGYSVKNIPSYGEWKVTISDDDWLKITELCKKQGYVTESGSADIKMFFEKKLGKVKYKYQTVSKVLDNGEEIAKIADELNAAKQALNDIPQMKLSGVWQEDVTLSDYAYKKDAIPKKVKYFEKEIKKWEIEANGSGSATYKEYAKGKVVEFKKHIDDLVEYEKQGEKYIKAAEAVNKLQKEQDKLLGKIIKQFDDADYTENAKKAAMNFSDRYKADKVLRPSLDRQWTQLSEQQKYSVWQYTEGSGGFNRPLSGYEHSWQRGDFKGIGNVSLSNENANRYVPNAFERFTHNGVVDYKKGVQSLTTAIEQTPFENSMWLVRGSDSSGLAGLLEGDLFTYDQAKSLINNGNINQMKQTLVGQEFTNHAYTSTGIAKDAGFSGNVKYEIYCPKGTKGIYAEPQSAYGRTARDTMYEAGKYYNSVGGEAEVILQRGTTFRITDVTEEYGTIKVQMEVVAQPDYFVTGLEQTITNGATKF